MELRGSWDMRLKQWYAVLFAALILELGMFAHPRASQAAANDDVEFLQPPGSENGDPDSGGQTRFWTQGWRMWVRSRVQSLVQTTHSRTRSAQAASVRTSPPRSSSTRR